MSVRTFPSDIHHTTRVVAPVHADHEVMIVDSPQKQEQAGGETADGDAVRLVDPYEAPQCQLQPNGEATAPGDQVVPEAVDGPPEQSPSQWQFPLPLDGSVELSEQQLLQHLPEFAVASSFDCEQCALRWQEATAGHQEVKQQLEGQKQVLSKLLTGTITEVLEPGVTYYLVPK